MSRERNLRFSAAPWYEAAHNTAVLVVGAGGIGSWTALSLARAGFNITIMDDDIVSMHNLGGQLFRKSDIGRSKVEAVSSIIKSYCDLNVTAVNKRFEDETIQSNNFGIVVSAVDNLDTRKSIVKDIWNCDKRSLFIDGRMTAESLIIYNVRGRDALHEYYNSIPPESSIDEGPCSFRATSFNGSIIGGLITSFAVSYLVEERDIPYRFRMDLPLLHTDIKWNYND